MLCFLILISIARPRYGGYGALGATAASIRRNGNLPSHVSALAILVPKRGYATEQSQNTSGSSGVPPPGFNAEQAKKPLPADQAQGLGAQANKETSPKGALSVQEQNVQNKAKDGEVAKAGEEKKAEEAKKEAKKLTMGQKIKKEAQHYWDGTKLLAAEARISSRLALKMAGGYELSRREHRQVRCIWVWWIG